MRLHLEFGGGLGDVFSQIFTNGTYPLLETLGPDDQAEIVLVTHNPGARELFHFHPRTDRIAIRDLGYWAPERDGEMRALHGLPPRVEGKPTDPGSGRIRFYPGPEDLDAIARVAQAARGRPSVVFSVTAGLCERDIPIDLVEGLQAMALARGFLPVFVGRNYPRKGRKEYLPCDPRALNLVDGLTVPGVAALVQEAAGIVTCHSALNLLAWHLRKPQLLVYPESVLARHIRVRDQWAFGIDYPECFHGLHSRPDFFGEAERFLSFLATGIRPGGSLIPAPTKENAMVVSELPAESAGVVLDETIGRLTPPHEVKYLCWLAGRTPGNVVEIGCNKGLTTRDLAAHNPHKIIYAVDWFADSAMADEQRAERPGPHDFCVYARRLRNVVCLHEKSAELNYRALVDVGLIFIDGDHSHAAVQADTEAALEYLRGRPGGGLLVWHDYYENPPQWVGVKAYLDSLDLPMERLAGTWLVTARIPGA